MTLVYQSTRDEKNRVTASQAILQGLATDGGLFTPITYPQVDLDFAKLKDASYQEVAKLVLSAFLDDFSEAELDYCINHAYDSKFDDAAIAPLVKLDGQYNLELFHGATIAFKDMALSILPHLMTTAAKKHGLENKIVILTATSGDTGKAAMAGFADVPGTEIIVFYPKDGVSKVQELQMTTQTGANTHVVAIDGNFDDAQTNVKHMFNDTDLRARLLEHKLQFSSANSMNIGRLVPQIVYNENNVLTDFFKTQVYDKKRSFKVTSSPSMDILVSSNLERLIFHLSGNSAEKTAALMAALNEHGQYELTDFDAEILELFAADYATEQETAAEIKRVYQASDYIEDPHTAVASAVYQKYLAETGDQRKTVIASTASPYKFPVVAVEAVTGQTGLSDFEALDQLHELSGVALPPAVDGLETAPVRHKTTVAADQMQAAVEDYLGL